MSIKKASDFIEQIFDGMEEAYPGEQRYVSLFQSWEQAAGTDIASHSKLREIENDTLIVTVDHPGWAQLLDIKKGSILSYIKKHFSELNIRRIRIIIEGDSRFINT